jgi:hypothetical protein
MTGVDSFSVTPLTNETVDGTTTWKEGQLPSTVNNGVRQLLADIRARWNDIPWFQYGNGDQDTSTHLAKPCLYVSATSFSVSGNGDQTAAYHVGRPLRAVGALTGTIYGAIASSAYNAGTDTNTIVATWASGTLSNEALVISLGLPITGNPTGIRVYLPPIYWQGKPTDAELYPIINIPVAMQLPVSLTGSYFTIATNPTATATFTLYKNGFSIGTIAFSTGGVATVTFATAISFAAGDQFSITAPTTQDSTGANVAMTFSFTAL